MRKLITVITVAALVISLSVASAYAGSTRRHTVEGVVLGTILGVTIASQLNNDRTPVYVDHNYRDHNYRDRNYRDHNYRDRNDNRGNRGWDHRQDGFSNRYPRNDYGDRWNSPKRYQPNHNRGHWVEKRVWVPPVYREVWVDGHRSSHRGHRVSGHYIQVLVRDGYYTMDRVWISRY